MSSLADAMERLAKFDRLLDATEASWLQLQGHAGAEDFERTLEAVRGEHRAAVKMVLLAYADSDALIDAAPDLLDACELGLAYMEERGLYDTAERAAPLRAAIAKARGGK